MWPDRPTAITRTTSWVQKLNSADPTTESGNTSRGRYTFLINPPLPTIDPVPPAMISVNRLQSVKPVNTKIAKSEISRCAPRNLPMAM